MLSALDHGTAHETGVSGDEDYEGKAQTIRAMASRAQLSEVSKELWVLARQYEQLGEFARQTALQTLQRPQAAPFDTDENGTRP
jgi:hypothetical protein